MKYLILSKVYGPIKCGDEKDWHESATDKNTMCGDCGCKVGQNILWAVTLRDVRPAICS